VTFLGVKTFFTLLHIFRGSRPLTPRIYTTDTKRRYFIHYHRWRGLDTGYQWCGLRPSVIGQDRSETRKSVLVLVLRISSCLHHCLLQICLRPARLDNLGSWWYPWADCTEYGRAYNVIIQWRTTVTALQHHRIQPFIHLLLYPTSAKLLLISRPAAGRRLSCTHYVSNLDYFNLVTSCTSSAASKLKHQFKISHQFSKPIDEPVLLDGLEC